MRVENVLQIDVNQMKITVKSYSSLHHPAVDIMDPLLD